MNGLSINPYYLDLLQSSDEEEVKKYLSGRKKQAEQLAAALSARSKTIFLCAEIIARVQADYFLLRSNTLHPLRFSDLATEIGVHESTVCRAVSDKYLLFNGNTYPFSFFFAKAVERGAEKGKTAYDIKKRMERLFDEEPSDRPYSDQEMAEILLKEGIGISRRAVAKYRTEMNIPNASGRKKRKTGC